MDHDDPNCAAGAEKSRKHPIRESIDARSKPVELPGELNRHTSDHPPEKDLRYSNLLDSMREGFILAEVISNEEGACNYRLLEVNQALGRLIGADPEALRGKTALQLFPKRDPSWIKTLCNVALSGKPAQFEKFSPFLNKWLSVSAFCPQKDRFACLLIDITERKQTEQALRDSEAHFRALAEASSEVLFRMSPDWSEMRRLHRRGFLEGTEDPNRSWLQDFVPAGDQMRLMAAINEAIRDKRFFQLEHRVKRLDGKVGWTITRAVPLLDANGEIVEWFGTADDVTKRKLAEQALRESEEKFHTIFRTSTSLITITSFGEARFIDVNDAFTDLTGYTREEVIGRTVEEVGVWAHPEQRRHLARRLEIEKRLVNEEITLRAKTGKIRTALMSACMAEIAGERVIVASARDITERKRAEDALRVSEERFRTLANNISQFAWIADPEGWTIWYNRRWYDFTGTDLEQVQGWGWTKVHHPDHLERVVAKISHCFRTGEVWEDTFPMRGKAGEYRWFLSRAIPIRDEAGKILRWFGTNTDVTEQRQAEQALLELTATLEQRVVERSQLAEDRAKQLQTMAVELIEAEERERRRLGELLHDDLQQILAAARMQLGAARENLLSSAPILEYVERLLDESITKTRHLSHEMSPPVLHHCGMLGAMQWMVQEMREKFGLQVLLDTDSELQWEHAPLKRFLFRAVQELLFNVVKHAGVKSARVTLSRTDGSLAITVSDRGKGFSPDILNAEAVKSGLGIISLKERVLAIGGDFVIETAPEQGSHVTLIVPDDLSIDGELQTPPDDRQACIQSMLEGKSDPVVIRTLFADDHHVMRQGLIRLISRQAGIQIVGEADNGRQALDLARRLKPDVVVMDVSMPGMDGIEATRHIKAEFPDVRVIGLSMYEDEQLSRLMRNAGAESLLNKTVSPTELLKAIYGGAKQK